MSLRTRLLAGAFVVAPTALACSEGDPAAAAQADAASKLGLSAQQLAGFASVDTAVQPEKMAAGESATVACTGQPGNVKIPKPVFVVKSAFSGTAKPDYTVNGATLTVRTAGAYTIACIAGSRTDATPAALDVVPAAAATVLAKLAPATIAAGEVAKISCSGKDAFGNEVGGKAEDWSATLTPPAIGELTGLEVAGRKVGKGDVQCARSGAADAKSTPAVLEVTPGTPAVTQASVAPPSIEAGAGSAEVACTAEDEYGNAVAVDAAKFTLDVPADLTLTGKKVQGTKAGKFDLKCALDGTKQQKPATLEVKPSAPISMTLYPKPKQEVFKTGETVQIFGLGKDKYGNDVPEMELIKPLALAPTDTTKANAGGKSYDFVADGWVTFSGVSKDYPKLSGSIKLLCDSTGPLVMIMSPKRGETRTGDAKVVVKGMVADELSPLKSFTFNGKPLQPKPDGSFEVPIDSVVGMNPIVWEAADKWDNKSSGVQTWYWSPKWYPADAKAPEASHVKDGIGFWMNQQTIDAGPPHNHKTPKDLASVFEMVLGTMDFGALLGGGKGGMPINQAGIFVGTITPKDIKMGDKSKNDGYPEVSLQVIAGGLHMGAKIHKFAMTLELNGKAGPGALLPVNNVGVFVTATMIQLDTDVMLSLDPKSGATKSEAKNTKVKLVDLKVHLPGIAGVLVNWLSDAVIGVLNPLIENLLADQIQKQIGTVLGDALNKLAIKTELPLKPFIGEGAEVKVKLDSKIGQLQFWPAKDKPPGGMLIGLNASFTAEKKVANVTLGSMGRAACAVPGGKEVFNPSLKYPLEVGMADDLINELLNGVWNGGLLKLTVGAEQLGSFDLTKYYVSDLSIETDFMLPPILNTCIDAGKGTIKLQIGDLGLHAKLKFGDTPIDLYLYAMMQATAELKAIDNPKTGQKELGFALKSIDQVELEIVQVNAEAKNLQELFVIMIKSVMLPKLAESLGSALGSFPLPAFDLSAFAPCDPANPGKTCIAKGTELALDIQVIENLAGFTYLKGKVKEPMPAK
jgi:hypothetical protein